MGHYQNTPFTYDFKSPSISCFDPTRQESVVKTKVTRYHYTSPSALLSILTPDNDGYAYLRFTDIRFMNDKSEIAICIKRILEYVLEHKDEYPYCLETISDLLLKHHSIDEYLNLTVNHIEYEDTEEFGFNPSRHFVLCLSSAKDSLHMWNYYVHNGYYQGYNIGFDIKPFLQFYDTKDSHEMDMLLIRYGQVLYSKTEQEKEFIPLLRKIEEYGFQNEKSFAMATLQEYIEKYGVFFKDAAFSDEKEYRIVIDITSDRINRIRDNHFNENIGQIKLQFYERNGVLVPCLVVPFNKDAVTTITTAPIMDHNLAKEGLKEFLTVHGYNCEVNVSQVPIRF